MTRIIIAVAVALLAGCTTMQGYQGMTAEQIGALAKMKDANINCVKGSTVWTGNFVTVFVNVDKGVIPDGGVTVDGDCKITLTNNRVVTTTTVTTTPIAPPAK